jgi:signal transduction histidine kinase
MKRLASGAPSPADGSVVTRVRIRIWRMMYEAKPERLINLGRLATSSFALLAVYLDPTQPTKNSSEIYEILAAYVAFSLAVVIISPRKRLNHPVHALAITIDVGLLGILAIISEQLDSPFFIFFNFTLIIAAIRWRWRGVLFTALVLQAQLLMIGVPDLESGDYALNVLIIRSVYCWVVAIMLGYFGSYRNRSEGRLRALAGWPHDVILKGDGPWVSTSLRHASNVFETNRIAVLWQDRDEAKACIAWWTGTECRFGEGIMMSGDGAMLIDDIGRRLTPDRYACALMSLRSALPASCEQLRDDVLGMTWKTIHVSRFESLRYRGSVIVVDPAFNDEDIAVLTKIVASRIAMQLEQFSLVNDFAANAGYRERARLARDLHDSVLQDLTAAVLQLDAAAKRLPDREEELARIRDLLKMQQRRIRSFVCGTRIQQSDCRLMDQLQTLVIPLETQWDCTITLKVDPADLKVSAAMAAELCLALSEATANAVRHGAAREIAVAILYRDQKLTVSISDDGRRENLASTCVPYSLSNRVADLGGQLQVAEDTSGYALTMDIPLERGRL